MVMLLLTTSTAKSTPLSLQERLRRKEVAMGVSNGIVTTPINAQEPYTAQGIGKYNGTWWDIVYGCANANGKINQWAKYKPERINTIMDITEDQRRSNMYGFSIPKLSTTNLNKNAVWTYLPPVPGTDWCRQNDFDGYDHNSVAPIDIDFPTALYTDATNFNMVYIHTDVDRATIYPGNILLTDIFYHYRNYYPGVIIYNATKKQSAWRTTEYTLANYLSGEGIDIPLLPGWAKGDTIEMYAMLSQYSYTGDVVSQPSLGDAFSLQYQSGKGWASAKIGQLYTELDYIKVVGTPVITFAKQWYNGEYHWHITEIRVPLKNTAPKTMNIAVTPYIEVEDSGDMYELDEKTTSLTSNGTTTLYYDVDIFIPSRYEVSEIRINVRDSYSGAGQGGTIFYQQYNFDTQTWLD